MIEVALLGATGRMGRAILEALREAPDLRLCGALASPGRTCDDSGALDALGVALAPDVERAIAEARVAIDFSVASATERTAAACAARGCALVLGVTGHDGDIARRLRDAASRIAIVASPNMSLGVNVSFALAAQAAGILREYDAEIVDVHHRHKRDAPSGTALRFGEIIAGARGVPLEAQIGARGGARTPGSVGFASIRAGDSAGEHRVLFADGGETVEIVHRAAGRGPYAVGALAAARWVSGRAPGLYGMHDVLGLAPSVR